MRLQTIARITEDGEEIVAVSVGYDHGFRAVELPQDSFTVEGFCVARVLTAAEACVSATPADGCQLVIQLEPDVTGDGDEARDEGRPAARRLRVRQVAPLVAADGTNLEPWVEAMATESVRDDMVDGFQHATFRDAALGVELAYGLFAPSAPPGARLPLVVFFHGGGEKGSDGWAPLLASQGATIWTDPAEQQRHPCWVLAPQCPEDGDWIDPDTYELGSYFEAADHLLNHVLDSCAVDLSRVYVTGLSMGSMAAWELAKRYPGLIAAQLQAAGQDNYEGIGALMDQPIWIFHAENDDKAMPGCLDIADSLEQAGSRVSRAVWDGALRGPAAERMAACQLDAGAGIMHTQFREGSLKEAWAHVGGWKPAYSNRVVRDWLFSTSKAVPSRERHSVASIAEEAPVPVDLGLSGRDIAGLSLGARHSLALRADGRVVAWGFNAAGQVGNGLHGHTPDVAPSLVPGVEGIVAVAAGTSFSLALDSSGDVWGWGSNSAGQVDPGSGELVVLSPRRVCGLPGIVAIGGGDCYAAALDADGRVWVWGTSASGQRGDGSFLRADRPVRVARGTGGLPAFVCLEVGVRTIMAADADGQVFCWGDGEYGQVGNGHAGHGLGVAVPTQVIDPAAASGVLRGARRLASGRCFSVATSADGSLWNWGLNKHGELGRGDAVDVLCPTRNPLLGDVGQVAAGMNHTVALGADGAVWTWGYNAEMGRGVLGRDGSVAGNRPGRVTGLPPVVRIASGQNHVLAVDDSGTVWGWGNAANGRIGPIAS